MGFHDIFGIVGVALIIAMYLLLQTGRIDPARPVFSALNALGAGLVLLSLTYDFNLAAVMIEGFWLAISLYGLWRALSQKRAD